MASLPSVGKVLRGRLSTYSIVKELHRAADNGAVFFAVMEKCILKSISGHWRLQNEADILRRYQLKTPFLCPLIDEIEEPSELLSIVLRYLENDLLSESNKKRLSRPQIKQVAKYQIGQHIFDNHGQGDQRFSTIQLGDCGGVVPQEFEFAKNGHLIGAGFMRSPEATLQIPWGTATDIWSFGNAILSLLYGGNYHLFNPGIEGYKSNDQDYEFTVLKRMYKFFGPFPESYNDFHDPDTAKIINFFNHQGPPEKPFYLVTRREIPPADNRCILMIMRLDPRDRPSVEQLLADEWFTEESEDTRGPLTGEVEKAKLSGEEKSLVLKA